MKTNVFIGGERFSYDLYRIKNGSFLVKGEELITTSHLDEELCKVRVNQITDEGVYVELVRDKPAGVFWKLTKRDFKEGVYLIEE